MGFKKPMWFSRYIACGFCSARDISKNSKFAKYTQRLRKGDIKVFCNIIWQIFILSEKI